MGNFNLKLLMVDVHEIHLSTSARCQVHINVDKKYLND